MPRNKPTVAITFSLLPAEDQAFRAWAAERCGGNKSAAFRLLLELAGVTKSAPVLSHQAT